MTTSYNAARVYRMHVHRHANRTGVAVEKCTSNSPQLKIASTPVYSLADQSVFAEYAKGQVPLKE